MPSSISPFPFSFLSTFSFHFYFVCSKGRGLEMLKVSDVTEWLPYVNINLSFVTVLCRPENYAICFTCQFNLNPSKDVTHLSKDIYDTRYSFQNILIPINLNLGRHFRVCCAEYLNISFVTKCKHAFVNKHFKI